jgi:hypothetical protein
VSTTSYEYDPDGRLISATTETVTETEPEFNDSDRDHIEALADLRASECPRCGNPLDQATVSWHVTHRQCNHCETVAYTQAVKGGTKGEEALKYAAQQARLWTAAPVLTAAEQAALNSGATKSEALAHGIAEGRHWKALQA